MSTRCTSPLESLAATAIAFAAGALALSLIGAWGDWREKRGAQSAPGSAPSAHDADAPEQD